LVTAGRETPLGRSVARRVRLPELMLSASAVAVCAVVLVGTELLSRRLDPHYLDRARGPETYSERYGWRLRPGFVGALHSIRTTVNARGFRGALHSYERTPGKTRLLMLGDSITFGSWVRDHETFSFLLEDRSDRYEVVNLAVEGYGTDQELLVFEDEGVRYRPDVVILNICVANDPLDNFLPNWFYWRPKPHFSWDGRLLMLHEDDLRLSPFRRAVQWLADDSHVVNRLGGLLLPRPSEPITFPPVRGNGRAFNRHAANELTVRLACEMRDVARRAGAEFLVLLHPDQPTFERESQVAATIGSGLRAEGVRVDDLVERYWAAKFSYEQIALDGQGHLTPLGHHVVAEEIETLLAPPPPQPARQPPIQLAGASAARPAVTARQDRHGAPSVR
jgi:GDSL-like lipase/acylhydrolase family protein